MKLTCVTATFNAVKAGNRERLIRCVASVAKLKIQHEHLIYDGASTDGTVELLRELEAKTPGLKVVSEPDSGIFNALNKGVRNAKGEWFYVLGADDYICDAAEMDRLIGETSSDIDNIIAPVDRGDAGWLFKSLSDLGTTLFGFPYSHQGMIMKTRLVRELNGFDERFISCADWYMQYQAYKRGATYRYVFKPFAFYATGGFSENSKYADVILRDHDIIHAFAMDLTKEEFEVFKQTWRLPWVKLVKLLFHKELAFRISARFLLRRMARRFIGKVFWPITVATRPLRYRNKI